MSYNKIEYSIPDCVPAMLLQTYNYFKQAASVRTVLTALGIVIFVGYITEKNKRSIAKRKLLTMKKVPLPAGSPRQVQSRSKSTSPLAPMSSSIQRRRHSESPEVDYETSIRSAIEKARVVLSTSDLKEVLPDELYDFVTEHHPKGQPSWKFLAAVTNDLSEYGERDWKLYLQNRRSRQRYRSFNDPRTSFARVPRQNYPFGTHVKEQTEMSDAADQVQSVSTQIAESVLPLMHLAPEMRQACFRRTAPSQAPSKETIESPRTTTPLLSEDSASAEHSTAPIPQPVRRNRLKRTAAIADLRHPKSHNITDSFPFLNGAVNAEDFDASERLKAKLGGSEDSELICTIGHSNEFQIQKWHLVSRKTLPFNKLFDNPQLAGHFLPANYHTTYNAVNYVLTERKNRNLTDAQVTQALMAFGSDLGVYECSRGRELADVEYMRPYNPEHEWGRVERQYWTALEAWKQRSLKDLGVWLMDDGRYVTTYDVHINQMGWEPYR